MGMGSGFPSDCQRTWVRQQGELMSHGVTFYLWETADRGKPAVNFLSIPPFRGLL